MTCGVFAFLFVSLPLFLSFLPLFYLFAYLRGFAFVVLVLSAFVALSLCLLFPLRTVRKKKGRAVLVRPLLSCCVLRCYLATPGITKLFAAVSILRSFPDIHATVKKLQL